MATLPEVEGRKRRLAPALTPRPVWAVEVDITGPADMLVLQAAAQQLFLRGRQGGTEAGVVILMVLPVLEGARGARLVHQSASGAVASSSGAPLVLADSSDPGELMNAHETLRTRLQVCMVFETARRKSSIKRTAQALLSSLANGESAAASLVPVTFSTMLARLSSQVATFALPRMQNNIVEYLSRRTVEDLQAPEPMNLTSDLLGPGKRPYLLRTDRQEKAAHPGDNDASDNAEANSFPKANESTEANEPTEAQVPAVDLLTDLLSWSGELTKAVAASRAEAILQLVRMQTEELAIARSELNYFKWQESLKAEVRAFRVLSVIACPLSHPTLSA